MNCKTCGSPLRAGAGFCGNCGAAVPLVVAEPEKESGIETQRCPKCGAENPAAAKFCRVDGYQFAGGAAEASPDVGSPRPRSTTSPSQADVPEFVDTGEVRCPRCGAINPRGSRFCRSDGAPLMPSARDELKSAARSPLSRRQVVIGVGLTVLLLTVAGLGYGYWTGLIGDRPGSIARAITQDLHKKGYDQVTVAVGKDWVALVTGAVVGQEQARAVEEALRGQAALKGMDLQGLQVNPSTDEIRSAVRNALDENQLESISAEVDESRNVTLAGRAGSEGDKSKAADVVGSVPGVSSVQNRIHMPYSVLERDINRALGNAGYFGVRAQVANDGSVVVSGTIQAEPDRAMIVANIVEASTALGEAFGSELVKDDMILAAPVVEAAPPVPTDVEQSSAARAAAAEPSTPPSSNGARYVACLRAGNSKANCENRYPQTAPSIYGLLKEPEFSSAAGGEGTSDMAPTGVWVGQIKAGIVGSDAAFDMQGGAVGQIVGRTEYSGSYLYCRGRLRLIQASPGVYVFDEEILEKNERATCPGGGKVTMVLSDPQVADVQWARRGLKYKGTLRR